MFKEPTDEQTINAEIQEWIEKGIKNFINPEIAVCALAVNFVDSTILSHPRIPSDTTIQKEIEVSIQNICMQTVGLLSCLGLESDDASEVSRYRLALTAPEGWGNIEMVREWALFTFGKPLKKIPPDQLREKLLESHADRLEVLTPDQRRQYLEYHVTEIEEFTRLPSDQLRKKLESQAESIMSIIKGKYLRQLSQK